MNKIQAYINYLSGFGLPVYDETSVPDTAQLPYMTCEVADDDFDHSLALVVSLFYRSTSWAEITAKANEIGEAITRGGVMIRYDGGAFWLRKANPWAQRLADENQDNVRRIVMNVQLEFID